MKYILFASLLLSGCIYKSQNIGDYFLNNPEKLQIALDNLANHQENSKNNKISLVINNNAKYIYNLSYGNLIGNKKASKSIVMLLDHNCAVCKSAIKNLGSESEIVKGNTKIIIKELPIIKNNSITLSKYALAAGMQGKYLEYIHTYSINNITPISSLEVVQKLNLDKYRFDNDINSQTINAEISRNINIAQLLGVSSTPVFIYNNKLYKGWGPKRIATIN